MMNNDFLLHNNLNSCFRVRDINDLQKLFRRRPVRELLPAHPIEISVEPWWMVQVGSVMEDDVKVGSTVVKQSF